MTLGNLLAMVFTLGWVPMFLYRTEDVSEAFPSYDRGERIWTVVTPAVLSMHVGASCFILSTVAPPPIWRVLLSVALYAAGVSFWFWARRAISPLNVRRLPDEPPPRLRRDGPFGMVRNPLYFGTLLAAAAPAVAAGEPILAITFAACAVALIVRSGQEERRLHAQLGADYADYCRRVKRLVPFLW